MRYLSGRVTEGFLTRTSRWDHLGYLCGGFPYSVNSALSVLSQMFFFVEVVSF